MWAKEAPSSAATDDGAESDTNTNPSLAETPVNWRPVKRSPLKADCQAAHQDDEAVRRDHAVRSRPCYSKPRRLMRDCLHNRHSCIREVCHKHRKIRRETNPAGVSSKELTAVFVLFCRSGTGAPCRGPCRHSLRSSFKSRMPVCQSGDAGASPAVRTISPDTRGECQPAQRSLQNSAGPGQHRDAVPSDDHPSSSKLRSRQVGRQRPHKPSTSQFDSGLRYQSHGLLDHSGGHLPCKQESGVRIPAVHQFHSIAGRLRTREVS